MSLLAYDRWTVDVLRFDGQKAYAVWLLLQQHPSLFGDDTSRSLDDWQREIMQPGIVWLGVHEKHVLVGIISLDFRVGDGNVETHIVFFDRKPAEKTVMLRMLLPIVLEAFPRIERLTTTVPDLYTHTWKLAKRIGLRWEGTLKGAFSLQGQKRDLLLFGAQREELLQKEIV